MPSNLTCLRVFIASPGGLADERKAFRDEIHEYNEAEAIPRNYFFQSLGWEDTLGGVGRPQTIINEDVRRADYFLLLLWDRWGSSPGTSLQGFTSGTEEEYHVGLECYEKKQLRQMVLLFKAVPLEQLSDPGEQLKKVLQFRTEIEQQKTHLFHSFDTIENFRKLIRKHLAAWLRREENGGEPLEAVSPIVGPGSKAVKVFSEPEAQQKLEPFATSLSTEAWALADAGRLTEAEVEFAKMVVGRQRPQALLDYGKFLLRVGRLDQANVLLQEAVNVATDQKDDRALATAFRNLGIVLEIRGDLAGAEQMYQKALEIDEKLGYLKGMAGDYVNLGNLLHIRGDLADAEQMYRKALEIDEKLGPSESMACAYMNLGNVLHIRGELAGAEQMQRKALETNEKLGHLVGMASTYMNLGNVLQARGDRAGAEQMYQKSLEIDEKLGHLEGMAGDYVKLGNLLQDRGDLAGAEQMYRKALKIVENLGHLEGIANAYVNLGNLLQVQGDLAGAEQMQRKALETNEKVGHLGGMASTYMNLGNVLQARGDQVGAEQMYQKALEMSERLSSVPMVTLCKSHLSSLSNKLASEILEENN